MTKKIKTLILTVFITSIGIGFVMNTVKKENDRIQLKVTIPHLAPGWDKFCDKRKDTVFYIPKELQIESRKYERIYDTRFGIFILDPHGWVYDSVKVISTSWIKLRTVIDTVYEDPNITVLFGDYPIKRGNVDIYELQVTNSRKIDMPDRMGAFKPSVVNKMIVARGQI